MDKAPRTRRRRQETLYTCTVKHFTIIFFSPSNFNYGARLGRGHSEGLGAIRWTAEGRGDSANSLGAIWRTAER